jgi:hypothetical protein
MKIHDKLNKYYIFRQKLKKLLAKVETKKKKLNLKHYISKINEMIKLEKEEIKSVFIYR